MRGWGRERKVPKDVLVWDWYAQRRADAEGVTVPWTSLAGAGGTAEGVVVLKTAVSVQHRGAQPSPHLLLPAGNSFFQLAKPSAGGQGSPGPLLCRPQQLSGNGEPGRHGKPRRVAQWPFRCPREQRSGKAPYKFALVLLCLSSLPRQPRRRRAKQGQVTPADFS